MTLYGVGLLSCSADEINGLQELFRAIDADGSGTITVDELRTAIGQINGGRLQARARRPCQPPSLFRASTGRNRATEGPA